MPPAKKNTKKVVKKAARGKTAAKKAAGKPRSPAPGVAPEGGGRPFKLTAARIDSIVEAMSVGATREVAARVGGLDPTTYYRYIRDGRELIDQEADPKDERDRLLVDLVERIDKAEVDAELQLLGHISKAGKRGDWRAAAHLLACRWPGRWSVKNRVEHTGADGNPIEVATGGVLDVLERHAVPPGGEGGSKGG